MTNWMTAAGIAFIAGGLATLISLRSVLFGGGRDRRVRDQPGEATPVDQPSRRTAATAPAASREMVPAAAREVVRQRSRSRARRPVESAFVEPAGPPAEEAVEQMPPAEPPEEQFGGLAAIGLAVEDELEPADEMPGEMPELFEEVAADLLPGPALTEHHHPGEPTLATPGERSRPTPVRRVDRSGRGYGDRVAGWVRPEYHDDPVEPSPGEYWTPVPMDELDLAMVEDDPEPSARGYGWPTLVERLPAVPDYEPATGFDLVPVLAQPTELVPVWPPLRDSSPSRVRLPRSWSSRNEKPADNRFTENETPVRPAPRDVVDQRFRAPTAEPERRRPRPRPRPGPPPDDVYVSRHAAEPPR